MGVLGAPLGHLWESLRVPWEHLGSAFGALAVLKIIEKPNVFIMFPAMEDPWATLERLWCVLWGHRALLLLGRLLALLGGAWALFGDLCADRDHRVVSL